MPDGPSVIEVKIRECLDLVNTEDRLRVRDIQAKAEDARREAQRVGDLVAEIGRQIAPLARQAYAGDPERLVDLTVLSRRLVDLGQEHAAGHLPKDWTAPDA